SSLEPLDALEQIYERWASEPVSGLPPLTSGFVGFIAWEAVNEIYKLDQASNPSHTIPAQSLSFVSELIVIDHREGVVILIANVLNDKPSGASASASEAEAREEEAWNEAQERLDTLQRELAKSAQSPLSIRKDDQQLITRVTSKEKFLDDVNRAKEHVNAGDVSQVVISQRFDTECPATPLDVYRVLRHTNPSPFLYLLNSLDNNGDPIGVVGSSPEALITLNEGHVITHPIAGSRPRGETLARDLELEQELLADKKEVSEHKMLVELSVTDLEKVCDRDTVEVSGYMRVERFSHVMHIVSTVGGKLAQGKNPLNALRATFPAGTLSGAPKEKALEIIDSLEPEPRGVFGGVVGYFGFSGSADLAIAIRTATIQNGVASVQAGAGIVEGSVPETEDQETRSKAAAPLAAISIACSMEEVK
ncbi:MAG TPA: chorismate-binding protein, partial [Microbacteriaceae bacterium]|nr:chorismate-binding protein [Microbacteriaceae bacterium]